MKVVYAAEFPDNPVFSNITKLVILIYLRNRPNQEILVPDWLITSHVTLITSSDWFMTTNMTTNIPLLGGSFNSTMSVTVSYPEELSSSNIAISWHDKVNLFYKCKEGLEHNKLNVL
eukprot:sb/3476559/